MPRSNGESRKSFLPAVSALHNVETVTTAEASDVTADPPVMRRSAGSTWAAPGTGSGSEVRTSSSSFPIARPDRDVWLDRGARLERDDDTLDGNAPALSRPVARVRRTTSPTVAAAAAARDRPISALAYRPVRGVTGASSVSATYGATRLPTPIDRLAMVSANS